MVKSHIVAVWRTMRVIDEERESVLEQKINEALEIQIQNDEHVNLYGIVQYANRNKNFCFQTCKFFLNLCLRKSNAKTYPIFFKQITSQN